MQEKLNKTSPGKYRIPRYLITSCWLCFEEVKGKNNSIRLIVNQDEFFMILTLVIVFWLTPKVSDIFNILAAKKQGRISESLEICHPAPIIDNLAA